MPFEWMDPPLLSFFSKMLQVNGQRVQCFSRGAGLSRGVPFFANASIHQPQQVHLDVPGIVGYKNCFRSAALTPSIPPVHTPAGLQHNTP